MLKVSCTLLLSTALVVIATNDTLDESLENCSFSMLQHKVESVSRLGDSSRHKREAAPESKEVLTRKVQDAMDMMDQDLDGACLKILQLQNSNREKGLKTIFGAPLSTFAILEAGIGEAAAQGLLRSLAAETVRGANPKGELCYQALAGAGVQYDHKRSVAHYDRTPSLWKALVAWNKRIMHDHDRLRNGIMMFAGFYGVPPHDKALRDMGEAGGFDQMISVLKNNISDLIVAQGAWAGLSDNVENFRTGAELAANNGGPNKGLETMIEIIKQYRGKHVYQPGMYFGLRYESIHDINGILMFDDENMTWTDAALRAGFMDEAVLAMAEEPDDHLTTSNGCEAITQMSRFSAATREKLVASGAVKHAAKGLVTFQGLPSPQVMGYRLLNTCSTAILALVGKDGDLEKERSESLDNLLDAGVLTALQASMPIWFLIPDDVSVRGSFYPWENVKKLRSALENRHKSRT